MTIRKVIEDLEKIDIRNSKMQHHNIRFGTIPCGKEAIEKGQTIYKTTVIIRNHTINISVAENN